MKQIVQNMKNGETEIVDVPIPKVKPGFILVKTGASLVSAGTERMLVDFSEKNLLQKAQSRPDLLSQVLQKAQRDGILTTIKSAFNRLDQPIVLGYSSAGSVVETGPDVDQFKTGDRVACAGGGYAVHAEYALIPVNLAVRLPEDVPFEEGAFATIGAIALNGIRLSQPQIGESTAVIGLGLLGLLTAQILKASGCKVAGIDLNPKRVAFAETLGLDAHLNDHMPDNYLQMTDGIGFDHVFICADTASSQPVELAGEISRDRANIIAVGAVGMDIPRKTYYEKELTFKVSRSYGPGRYDPSYEEEGHDYPAGYIRWSEGRNIAAVVAMVSKKQMDVRSLITHRFGIEEARDAYGLLSGKTGADYLGLIITYPSKKDAIDEGRLIRFSTPHAQTHKTLLNVGVIGAGNYANATFLPILNRNLNTRSYGVVSAKGLHAQQAAKKFGFAFASSDQKDILENEQVDIAVILTQHDMHAPLTVAALEKGKHVYCEKPLAIEPAGVEAVMTELKKEDHPYLTVGFNRRFAPLVQEMRSHLAESDEPVYAHYRINAGYLPPDHWLHDRSTGGGRLIGEACHFIDLILFLIDAAPTTVQTQVLPNSGKYTMDNFLITIQCADGSLASIAYMANGSKAASKEYLEVFSGGKTLILDDFRKLMIYGKSLNTKRSGMKQDKGHAAAWDAFISAITNHSQPPIPYEALIQSSYATLACDLSLQKNSVVHIADFIGGNKT